MWPYGCLVRSGFQKLTAGLSETISHVVQYAEVKWESYVQRQKGNNYDCLLSIYCFVYHEVLASPGSLPASTEESAWSSEEEMSRKHDKVKFLILRQSIDTSAST